VGEKCASPVADCCNGCSLNRESRKMGARALSGGVVGNATLFSEGLSDAIKSGGLNSASRIAQPVFLSKVGGPRTGGWDHMWK
jgi:hypothetical protein